MTAALGPVPALAPKPEYRHPDGGWMPCRWNEELGGCVFLPRVLEKGRRFLESERSGQALMNGYIFGDFDYADGMVLRFLRTNEDRLLELLRAEEEDGAVAEQLFRESGRTAGAIASWSRRFRLINAPFGPMWDADEGRRGPGWGTTLLNGFYNHLMMPPVYLCYGFLRERRKRRRASK